LNGLMIASIFFIWFTPGKVRASSSICVRPARQRASQWAGTTSLA